MLAGGHVSGHTDPRTKDTRSWSKWLRRPGLRFFMCCRERAVPNRQGARQLAGPINLGLSSDLVGLGGGQWGPGLALP